MNPSHRAPLGTALLLAFVSAATAQSGGSDRKVARTRMKPVVFHGEVIAEAPHQRALLDRRWGEVRFPITCVRPESQDYFNQGVAQLHTDALAEAERSFRWVVTAEPDCAMAHLGVAIANVFHPARAALALERALLLRGKCQPVEQAFLDAWAKFYETDPESAGKRVQDYDAQPGTKSCPERAFQREAKVRSSQLARDLGAISKRFPKHGEALAFYIRQLCHNRRAGWPSRPRGVIDSEIEKLIVSNRRHPGHYYRVLLWERTNASRAKKAASFATVAAPLSRAVWHVSGRVRARVGDHGAAARFFAATARVDHARMERFRLMPFDVHGYAANLELLCQSLRRAGRFREALAWARYMLSLPRPPAAEEGAVNARRQDFAVVGARALAATCHAAGWGLDADLDGVGIVGGLDAAALATVRSSINPWAGLDWQLDAGRFREAMKTLDERSRSGQDSVPLLARQLRVLAKREDQALLAARFDRLRVLAGRADLDAPVLESLVPVARQLMGEAGAKPLDWRHPAQGPVPVWPVRDLSELGPRFWRPPVPRAFTLSNHLGKRIRSRDLRGRAHVVVFFIGNGCCLSCVPQLHLFNAQADRFKEAGVDIAVVSFHSAQDVRDSMDKMGEHGFPFLLLADPRMRTWHEWLTIDQYDHTPLFGTFLLDARGRVRWRTIGERAFEDPAWLVDEARRLLAQPAGPATR